MTKSIQLLIGIGVVLFSFNQTDPHPKIFDTSKPTPAATSKVVPDEIKKQLPPNVVVEEPISFQELIKMYNECLVINGKLSKENEILKRENKNLLYRIEQTKSSYNEWHIGAGVFLVMAFIFSAYLVGRSQKKKSERPKCTKREEPQSGEVEPKKIKPKVKPRPKKKAKKKTNFPFSVAR